MERDGCMGEGIGDVVRGVGVGGEGIGAVVRGVGVWGAASLQRGSQPNKSFSQDMSSTK